MRGPLEERPGYGSEASPGAPLREEMDKQWVGAAAVLVPGVYAPAAPQEPGAAVRRDPVLHPALAALRGAGRWSPKRLFPARLLATPAPPATPVHRILHQRP